MIKKQFLHGLIWALAGTILWAGLSWGQGQGQGAGPRGGSGQCAGGVCRVPEQGAPVCPNNPGTPPCCARNQGPKGKGPQGQGGPGKKDPNPPATPPAETK